MAGPAAAVLVLLAALMCQFVAAVPAPPPGPEFWLVSPDEGSLLGGTRVTIFGQGFSNASSTGMGNEVWIGDARCELIQLHSTPNQLVCKTTAPSLYRDVTYEVHILVDGSKWATCTGAPQTNCDFRFRSDRMSNIYGMSTHTVVEPWEMLTVSGQMRFGHYTDEDFMAPSREVTPIAVKILNKDGLPGDSGLGGNGDFCQLFDPVTGDAFGYKDGTSGHVMCAVTNVDREAGFYNISLVQADEYGEARIYDSAWAYDLEGRAYSLAFSPKVNEVTPAAGSRAGGTLLTISGHTFSTNEDAVSVTVGGIPCDVESASLTQIVCRLAGRNSSEPVPAWQAGSRGVDMRFYKSGYNPGHQLEDPTIRNDERWRSYTEVSLFTTPTHFGDHYVSRHQAFFTAPRSGTYRFNIVGDDSTYLYIAYDGNPDNAVEEAGYWGHTGTTEHYKYSQQFTSPRWIEEGQRVYLRVESIEWGGGDHTGVAVEILESQYNKLDITGDGIEAPRQVVRLRYAYAPERQTVRIVPETGSARDLAGTFTLGMNGFQTPPIAYNASADAVYEALVDMQEFQCEYPTDDSPDQRFFDLDQMETTDDMWRERNGVVPYQALGKAYCGRYGMGVRANYARNWEGSSLEVNQTERVWRTSTYPYMCAAFNVPPRVSANILLYVSGIGWRSVSVAQDNDVEYPINYPVMASFGFKEDGIAGDNKWHYRCINVWEQMREADPTRDYHDITAVIFHNSGAPNVNGHFYTDEFSISREPREVVRSSGFSLPGDTHIREMTIEKEYTDELGLEYSFQFRSYDCAAGFLPLEVDVSGMTGPAAAVVERTQAHSPKPGGHVSVTIANQTASWHPQANEIEVAAAWREQTTLNVEVATSHVCENSEMRFYLRVLDHRGGIDELFDTDVSGLENIWGHSNWFNRRGGVFANRLSAAYLTVPVQSPYGRVEVRVNDQAAVCDDDAACEFDFQEALTPTINSASFDAASSALTVSGYRFGTDADKVAVWAGDDACEVTAASNTQVQCTLAAYSAGDAEVMVLVEGAGLANTTAWVSLPVKVVQATPSMAYAPVETEVVVQGNGFNQQAELNEVMIGDQVCLVVAATGDQLKCRTVNEGTPGVGQDVVVKVKALAPVLDPATNKTVIAAVEQGQDVLPAFFDILPYVAPTVTGVDPAMGSARGGTAIEVSGTNLDRAGLQVLLGGAECVVTARESTRIACTTSQSQPGNVSVVLVEEGLPSVVSDVTYRYHLLVTGVQGVSRGSWAGGAAIRVLGSGFTPSEAGGDDASVVLRATMPEVQVVSLYAARPATTVQQVEVTANAVDEVQTVSVANATGGTFTLAFGGDATTALAWDTNEFMIKKALEALPALPLVRVTPEPSHEAATMWGGAAWKVTFMGGLGDLPLLGADASSLITGPATVAASVTVAPARDGNAAGGTFTLSYDGEETGALAADATAAEVEAELDALPGTGGVWVEREDLGDGVVWTVTFDDSVPEGSRERLLVDESLLTGSGVDSRVTTVVDGTQPVAGSFTVAVGGAWTEPIPANATAAKMEAAVAAVASVVPGSVSVRRVDDQPGKKFGSWYPHQWILTFKLRAAADARSDVVCTQPMRINWRPEACPTYAADLYLSHHVAEFPVFMNRPADYGSPTHRAHVQALCDAEAVASGLTVGGCESELVAQSRPYCAGAAAAHGSSSPPCWEVRWTTVRVVHRDGTQAVYVQQNDGVSSDTQKGYRYWLQVAEVEAAAAALTRANVSGLVGTGAGVDVVRRRAGGSVEVSADITSRADGVIEATVPMVPSGMVPDYAADVLQVGAVEPVGYWSMAGSHAATRIVKNSGRLGTKADGTASLTAVLPAGADPPGFDLVAVDGSAYLADGAFAGVTVPFVSTLNLYRSVTVEGWFAPSPATVAAAGDTPLITSMDVESSAGYALMLANGAWEFWVGPGGDPPANVADVASLRPNRTRYVTVASSAAAVADAWTHVAGVYDSEMGTIQVYVNGVASAAVDVLTYAANPRAKLRIGGTCAVADRHQCGPGGVCSADPVCTNSGGGVTLTNATALPYGGFIDEVAVYNAALDSQELAWHAGYAAAATASAQVHVAFGVGSTATCNMATTAAGAAGCDFTYAADASPGVAAALPRRQSSGAPLTLVGSNLDLPGVEVRFGGADWGCSVVSGAQLACTVPAAQAGGAIAITCSVPGGVGDCVVDDTAASVTVLPVVSRIDGNETSLMGGNDIVITGSGFGSAVDAVQVSVSWWDCDVTAVTPSTVTCTAPAIPSEEFPAFVPPGLELAYPLVVSVNGVEAAGCGAMPCGVAYLEELTPQVTELSMVAGGAAGTALVEGATVLVKGVNLDVGTGAAGTVGDNRLRLGTGTGGGDFVDCMPQPRADGDAPSDMEYNCTVGTGPGGNLPATFRAGAMRGLVMGKASTTVPKQVVVTSVSPDVGSMAGGTLMNVTGSGFSSYPNEISLWMGAGSCVVQEATPTWFTCLTPPVGGYYGSPARRAVAAPPAPAAVFAAAPADEAQAVLAALAMHEAPAGRTLVENPGVSGHKNRPGVISASMWISVNQAASMVACEAGAPEPCATAFAYNSSYTPVITSVEVDAAGVVVTVTGGGFDGDMAMNQVAVGGAPCTLTSASPTSLVCTLSAALQQAGAYAVNVLVAGAGAAERHMNSTVADVSVVVPVTVTGIDVATGSAAGGLEVTLTGSGFDPAASENTVHVCGAACPVSAATPTTLTCAVPSALHPQPLNDGRVILTVANGIDDVEEMTSNGRVLVAGSAGVTSCAAGTGVAYRGPQNRTREGHTCQKWSLDTPHSHGQNGPDTFRGTGDHNYCRNPDSENEGPWCYTTTTTKRWDWCDVPQCSQADNRLSMGDPQALQGLRFTGVDIPQGATVTSAHLRFTAFHRSCSAGTSMLVRVEDSDNASPYSPVFHTVSSRRYMRDVNATWAPTAHWTWAGGTEETSDIADVITAVVNRPGWRAGSALALMITPLTGDAACAAHSAEDGPDKAPQLVVEYTTAAVTLAEQVATVKDCDVTVSVTSLPDGMAGKVLDFAAAGDGFVAADDWASLLPVVDLSNGASASASSSEETFQREMLDLVGGRFSWQTSRDQCLNRGGDLCTSWQLCEPHPKYRWTGTKWYEDPGGRNYAPTLDGAVEPNTWGTWAHISGGPPYGHTQSCNTFRRVHGGFWHGNGDSVTSDYKGHIGCCYGRGFPATNLVDGQYMSSWRSAPDAGADGSPVELVVDLRAGAVNSTASGTQVVRAVSVEFEDEYFAREYTVELSVDGASWTTVVDFDRGTRDIISHELRTLAAPFGLRARYVRVRLLEAAVTSAQGGSLYRVRNVRVTGHASAVSSVTVAAGAAGSFQYRGDAAPVVDRVIAHGRTPARGTTAGNTHLTIVGTGFTAAATVTVGDMDCPVQAGGNATHIFCLTPAVELTDGGLRRVTVTVPGVGSSLPNQRSTFLYADLWSSPTTWGGSAPPAGCGDFEHDRECVDSVIIPAGQVITLDVSPPRFFLILVQGTLVFDPEAPELELQATYLLVHGGTLQIGTEDEPHQGKATITLFGHFGNRELPTFGAKVLGCYKCTLDIHGKDHPRVWTRLAERANVGDTQITLQESAASWPVGAWVVLATTAQDREQNEVRRIDAVSADGLTLTLGGGDPLEYMHLSDKLTIAGRELEFAGEVALLSRNIVIQGDADSHNCGPESVAEDGTPLSCNFFGGHVFLHSPGHESLEARVEGVEFRNTGQAFRLGRYALHYHMIGNVRRSYVRSNSFHHSWNRGLALHGVNFLRVENNVAFKVHGHSFFIEDGVEHGNVINGNIGIRTIASPSLLNTDMTPAVFWVTNPDNEVTNNVAVASDNYGFWYRPEIAATGTSSHTPDVHPVNERLGTYRGNTAHSHGRYGLRIYPTYHPTAVATFEDLFTWRNLVGLVPTEMTLLKFDNIVAVENRAAGWEARQVVSEWGDMGIYNSLFVGSTTLPHEETFTPGKGIWLPFKLGMQVHDTTFVNYTDGQGAFHFCAHCGRGGSPSPPNGGFETRTRGLTFIDTPQRATFRHVFEGILHDMDGSLTGLGPDTYMVGDSNLIPPTHCASTDMSTLGAGGAVCTGDVRPRRVWISPPQPTEFLDGVPGLIESEQGAEGLPYIKKSGGLKRGYMFTAFADHRYTLDFDVPNVDVEDVTIEIDEIADGEILYISQRIEEWLEVDIIGRPLYNSPISSYLGVNDQATNWTTVFGDDKVGSALVPRPTEPIGSYVMELDDDENGGLHTMLFKGCGDRDDKPNCLVALWMRVRPCPGTGCWPPPPLVDLTGKEDFNRTWSNATTWAGNPTHIANPLNLIDPEDPTQLLLQQEWAGEVPQDGDSVWIPKSMTVIIDVDTPDLDVLIIDGTLLFSDDRDVELRARHIVINGGLLGAGTPTRPHQHMAIITLLGDLSTRPELLGREGIEVGGKSLIVAGNLTLYGQPRSTWTRLAVTADAGSDVLTVQGAVNWQAGDVVIVASTTFDPAWAEDRTVASTAPGATPGTTDVKVTEPLQHRHFSGVESHGTRSMEMAAEVAVVSHNVVIQGSDDAGDDIGGQLIVAEYTRDVWDCTSPPCVPGFVQDLEGNAQVHNVEIRKMGQFGRDGRSAVVINAPVGGANSDFAGSSIHTSFNRAFHVLRARGMEVKDLVVIGSVGSSYRVDRSAVDTVLRHNMGLGMMFPTTYKGLNGKEQREPVRAVFEVLGARTRLFDNAAAGSERGAYAGVGITGCGLTTAQRDAWMHGNTGHSSLFGWFSHSLPATQCSTVHGFTFYKILDYGVFWEVTNNVEGSQLRIADTKVGIAMILVGPHWSRRQKSQGTVSDVMIVGSSANEECGLPSITPYMCKLANAWCKNPNTPHVGMFIPTFASSFNMGPRIKEWTSGDSYPAIEGTSFLTGVTFAKFSTMCGNRRTFMIKHNPLQPDASGPLHVAQAEVVASEEDSVANIEPPKASWVALDDCVNMDCPGPKHVFVHDADGTLLGGTGGYVLPRAEYVSPKAVAGTVAPKTLMSDRLGNPLTEAEVMPNGYGLVRPGCTLNPTWNAYKCGDALTYRRFVMENLDSDREIRALSPVAISADGWTDLMNECQDHGWCQSYTCLKRLTTYHAVVATGRTYTIHLTGSNPVKTRFHLMEAAADESLVLYVYYTGGSRLQVFTGPTGDNFIEDMNMLDGKRKALLHKQGRLAGNNPDGSWTDENVALGDAHGTNTYDRGTKMMRVAVKGDQPLTIVQMPVVQVGMNLAVSEADFFAMQSEFISSIAEMLGIPPERIAITDVIADTGLARRLVRDYDGVLRERRMAEGVQVEFEVTPSPEVNLQAEDVEVLETVGSITLTLTRSVNVFGAVNVTYDTLNSTAVWGTHFQRVHGMVTFADKEVTKTLTVPILPTADFDPDSPRTMTFHIEATGGGVTGSRSDVIVTIHSITPPVPGAATMPSLASPKQMTVAWTAPTWPNAPDGYALASQQLQRRPAGSTDWLAAITVDLASTATSFTVTSLDTYSAHEFRLRVGTDGGAFGAWGPTSAVLRTASECGDGRRHGTEGCDDGNTNSGDGCSLLCKPEAGFACSGGETGGSDTCAAGCGDGLRAGAEECDANGESAGCDDACRVVAGWTCTGGTPSSKDTCTAVCGDSVQAMAAEECDDGNDATGDGCDATCEIEPDFTCVSDAAGLSVCQSCGNGKTEGTEACDDEGAAGGCNDMCSGIDAGWLCSGGSASSPDVCVGGPATPAAPTFKLVTDSSITFAWLAVTGNGLPITGYTLEYRDEAAPDVWNAVAATTELKVKLDNLRPSASFRARVTAATTAGSSAVSALSAVATTLDAEETVELETDSNASDELNGLMDNLLSGAATSDYLDGLGVGGFELVPPPPPPEVPLEDDGSIENLDDVEDLLESLGGNETLGGDIEVPEEDEEADEPDVGVGVSIGPGEFSFAKSTAKVSESGGSISIVVKRENGAFGAVGVAYATADLTAVAGQHYTALSGVLTFAKGELEKTLVVSVTNNDEFVNSPPKFTLTLASPTGGATIGSKPVITISIQEDDAATLLEFSANTATVVETAGTVTLSLERSRATGLPMVATVKLTELDGAAQGSVFGGARTLSVTVPGGAATTFTVPVIDQKTSVAVLRRFTATLESTTNGLVGSAAAVTVDVTHSDCRPRDVCVNGASCGAEADCQSGVCTGAGVCAATATCLDGAKNQDESDVDCGGSCATKCALTKACGANSDCGVTAMCSGNVCVLAPTCVDGAKNGVESDVDCGGVCLATCAAGKMCARDIDCDDGHSCDAGSSTCVPDDSCNDGEKGANEADIDCGGVCRATCDEGATCASDLDCSKGACVSGTCSATHRVGGELKLVGYRPEEVTPRVLQLLRAGLAQHLGVSYSAVHAWLKGSGGGSARLLVRSASDEASVEYTVYTSDATAASAAKTKMSDPAQAPALSSALASEGVDALDVEVTSTTEVVTLNPDGGGGSTGTKSGFTSTMLMLVIGGAAVALVGIIVIMYTAGLCCCNSRPTVKPTGGKGSAPTPSAPDGTVRALSPEYVARLEARGEYIAGGKVYNPNQPGVAHQIDPQAFTYYKSQALPAPINSRVKPWQRRQVNQKAFEPATVAGVIEQAKMTITTPARRRSDASGSRSPARPSPTGMSRSGSRSPARPAPSGHARSEDRPNPSASPSANPPADQQGLPAVSSPPGVAHH